MASAVLPLPKGASTIEEMSAHDSNSTVTLFLCGDVMLGRGIDQILPHPGDPPLHEPYVGSATTYVELAEAAHVPIPRPVDDAYIWADFAATGGDLAAFPLEVFQIRKFRLRQASAEDAQSLQAVLDRESRRLGTRVEWRGANRLAVVW